MPVAPARTTRQRSHHPREPRAKTWFRHPCASPSLQNTHLSAPSLARWRISRARCRPARHQPHAWRAPAQPWRPESVQRAVNPSPRVPAVAWPATPSSETMTRVPSREMPRARRTRGRRRRTQLYRTTARSIRVTSSSRTAMTAMRRRRRHRVRRCAASCAPIRRRRGRRARRTRRGVCGMFVIVRRRGRTTRSRATRATRRRHSLAHGCGGERLFRVFYK